MGFLRKCGGEVRKVVKMDWGGITKYIWRRITTNFRDGLGRRNKGLNEFLGARGTGAKHCSSLCSQSEGDGYVANLSEIYCGLCGAAAPVRGSYSRIGACPYLSPQLIDSRCCPCKGRISWAGLAPQQDSRYEPLTGARFINRLQEVGASPYPKYEPLSGAACAATLAASALKGQPVLSPGQRPGYQCINAYAL